MPKKEILKRYVLLIIGLFFSAFGVAVTKRGELGVSPISSVANVMSCKFTALSLGNWLIIWNCVLIIGQIILLRKNFKPIQFLQIPVSFLFGWFTDIGTLCISFIPANIYIIRIIMVLCGTALLGLGIALCVTANVVMNSGEAFVKAISDITNKNFGNVKIAFDISCVTLAVLISLIFFDFRIVGTREGTVIAAVCTGIAVKFFSKLLQRSVSKILTAG
ncbi:MAG: YitT family protein [Oscillospiraceae bacterium]|nr:YitT family protein [Oscillospiraceae bacterium]